MDVMLLNNWISEKSCQITKKCNFLTFQGNRKLNRPARKRRYFTLESAITARLRDVPRKLHHGILFAPPLLKNQRRGNQQICQQHHFVSLKVIWKSRTWEQRMSVCHLYMVGNLNVSFQRRPTWNLMTGNRFVSLTRDYKWSLRETICKILQNCSKILTVLHKAIDLHVYLIFCS